MCGQHQKAVVTGSHSVEGEKAQVPLGTNRSQNQISLCSVFFEQCTSETAAYNNVGYSQDV